VIPALADGMFLQGTGQAAAMRQAPVIEVLVTGTTPPPRSKEGTHPGRVSCVRNTGTVRHEALYDRAEVKGLRRRVVAATRLELRAA
jgi:hypothetical protein